MIYRIKRVNSEANGYDFTGYSDSFERGQVMHIWWDYDGIIIHLKTDPVEDVENNYTKDGLIRWIAKTKNSIYDVLPLTERMVEEIGIKGVLK